MLRWLVTCGIVVLLAVGGFYLLVGAPRPVEQAAVPVKADAPQAPVTKTAAAKNQLLAAEAPAAARTAQDRGEPVPPIPIGAQPLIVISGGRVSPIDKQDVPAQHDGQILFIGTEITQDE